jgi:hypothetical protein
MRRQFVLSIITRGLLAGCYCCALSLQAFSQSEFPKGWVLYVEGNQGVNTSFTEAPDLYLGGLSLKPMITVIPDHLRLGAAAGFIYTNKVFDGVAGPQLAWKLKTFSAPNMGGFANLQLQLGCGWGGSGHAYAGGGPYVEIARRFQLSLTAYRDYGVNSWWILMGLGVNLVHKKFQTNPFDH